MLANEKLLFIDPLTEAPFKYLIPRSAWPKMGAFQNPQFEQELAAVKIMWMEQRQKICQEQRQKSMIRGELCCFSFPSAFV
jgi:hypothetical protein